MSRECRVPDEARLEYARARTTARVVTASSRINNGKVTLTAPNARAVAAAHGDGTRARTEHICDKLIGFVFRPSRAKPKTDTRLPAVLLNTVISRVYYLLFARCARGSLSGWFGFMSTAHSWWGGWGKEMTKMKMMMCCDVVNYWFT